MSKKKMSNKMIMPKLIPCPWCGTEGQIAIPVLGLRYRAYCPNRHCPVGPETNRSFKTIMEAAVAWGIKK